MNRRLFLSLLPIPFLVKKSKPKLFVWDMNPAQEKFFNTVYGHEMKIVNMKSPLIFGRG